MVIYVLLITMIFLTCFIYKYAKQSIISPAIAFMLPFCIAILWLTFNISRWSVELNWNTYFVIIGGTISLLTGIFTAYFFNHKNENTNTKITAQNIPNSSLILFTILELISMFLCFIAIIHVAESYGYGGDISNKIYGYRCLSVYTTNNISLGEINDWLYAFNVASGYIWAYLIIKQLHSKAKQNPILWLNFFISLLTALMKGGRQSAVQIIISAIVMYLLFYLIKNNKYKINIKKIFPILLLIILIGFAFQSVGSFLGRTVQADMFQYVSVYLSGGIQNLNNYLSFDHDTPVIFGKMTFIFLINYLGKKFGMSDWVYPLDLPYQTANGLNTGNIYTTFYAYIYDFGYIGIIILPFIIGFVSEIIYIKAKNTNLNNEKINLSIILYSYIFYTLAFSFFSNKFFEGTCTPTFIKYVIIWLLLKYIIQKMSVKQTN